MLGAAFLILAAAPPSYADCYQQVVFFGAGSAQLDAEARAILSNAREAAKLFLDVGYLELDAHTDTRGSAAQNLSLAKRRGEAVKRHLVGLGLLKRKIRIRAVGESASWGDPAQDRRVHLNFRFPRAAWPYRFGKTVC